MKKISLTETEVNELLDLYQSEIDRAQRRISNLKTIIKKLSEGSAIESSTEKPVKVKSKRGRKPNARPIEAKVVVETKEAKKVKDEVIVPEPKERGRKKKFVELKAEPKKRGRKKKVVIAKATPKIRGRKTKSLRKPIKGGKGENKVKWNDFIVETIKAKNSLMLASSLTQAALEKFQIPASDRDRVRMAISTTLTKMANKDKVLTTHSEKGIRGAFFGLASWFNDKGKLNSEYKKKLM
jgi:preprotein translocase subunit SecD